MVFDGTFQSAALNAAIHSVDRGLAALQGSRCHRFGARALDTAKSHIYTFSRDWNNNREEAHLKKRLWAITAAVILGGGLATAMSTPALAVNNFWINWASLRGHGSIPLACVHGQNYYNPTSFAVSFQNNCDVRVWVYYIDPSVSQCVSPKSFASTGLPEVSRVWISENSANC